MINFLEEHLYQIILIVFIFVIPPFLLLTQGKPYTKKSEKAERLALVSFITGIVLFIFPYIFGEGITTGLGIIGLLLFFPALWILSGVFYIEFGHNLYEAPEWYRKFRNSKIGGIIVGIIVLIIALWIVSANFYCFYCK